MSGIHVVAGTLLAVIALSTSFISRAANADEQLRADLEHISQLRIFFGHQSVGINLLDGIKQLSSTAGTPVRIVEVNTANAVQPATIGHAFIAENGNPLLKLNNFEQAMGLHHTGLDVALVKFCFIDFNSGTDAKELFARYRTSLDTLRARNPGTVFVHVTVPLTTVGSGIKIRIKQLLGSAPPGTAENLRREEYNALLRQTYKGKEPIFDLAHFESTAPNGTPEEVKFIGRAVPVMLPEYSDDGGHLNASANLRAALELVSVLAAIPFRSSAR